MIHVNRSNVTIPDILNGNQSQGFNERKRAETFYDNPANKGKSFNFSVYRHKAVKDKLFELFREKCAYCEYTLHGFPFPVEHFRPKGAVVHQGKLSKPGYYWLAADWNNLLPSCVDCNSERYQDFPDIEPQLSGKANKFPIANPDHRATKPGEEQKEVRLLLDPCRDFPERAFEFDDIGVIHPKKSASGLTQRKAQTSIETYGLNRQVLVDIRRALIIRLATQRGRVNEIAQEIIDHPDDLDFRKKLAREIRELLNFCNNTEPFLSLVHQHLDQFIAGVEIFIKEWFGEDFEITPGEANPIEKFIQRYAPREGQPSPTPIEDLLARHSN
jgi:uncharacterized protein (TIGR02646 family)